MGSIQFREVAHDKGGAHARFFVRGIHAAGSSSGESASSVVHHGMLDLTREQMEELRDELDRAIRELAQEGGE